MLGPTAIAVSSCLRYQVDSDVPRDRLRIGAISDLAPADGTDRLVVRFQLHDQGSTLRTDQSGLLNTSSNRAPWYAKVVEFADVLSRMP